jgi:Trk K+ transport system NAD-binding subunit
VWLLLAVIATVLTIATTTFALGLHIAAVDALYFSVTTMATVGYGDISLAHEAAWLKLFDIGLMGSSAVLLASFLALVTDRLVSTRIDSALGRFPLPKEDHVIVCGLGKAGSRIIAALHELDVPCVGVEQYAQAAGVAVARGLKIPVIVADARTPGTLDQLRVGSARAVMAVTDDDLANLQAGLAARERNPGLRIVLRCFDPHLAARLDRSMELDLTRSVAGLAAPAFAAALLGRAVAEPLPLSNVPLRVLETTVDAASPYAGRVIRDLHHEREVRVLALDGRWRPRTDLVVEAGMAIAVVGTREACDALSRTG